MAKKVAAPLWGLPEMGGLKRCNPASHRSRRPAVHRVWGVRALGLRASTGSEEPQVEWREGCEHRGCMGLHTRALSVPPPDPSAQPSHPHLCKGVRASSSQGRAEGTRDKTCTLRWPVATLLSLRSNLTGSALAERLTLGRNHTKVVLCVLQSG